jgi:hypothetical protein
MFHTLLQDNKLNSVIISRLAVLGIQDNQSWLDADDYTPKYSAIIKLTQLIVVQEGYKRRQEVIHQLQERGLTADEKTKEEAHSHYYPQSTYRFMTKRHSSQIRRLWIGFSGLSYIDLRLSTVHPTADGGIQWIWDTVLYQ